MATKFSTGDKVSIKTKDSEFEGLVMPSADEELLTIKLSSGYNLAFKQKDVSVKKIGVGEKAREVSIKAPVKKGLPNIVVIATGGTITSKVDYTTGGVSPLTKPEELLLATPELLDIVNIKRVV